MRNDRLLFVAALILAVVLLVVAVIYVFEPAHALPSFFPGHSPSNRHHLKHGFAALLLSIAALVFAWFRSGPTRTASPRR